MKNDIHRLDQLDRRDGSRVRIDWIGDVVGHRHKFVRVVTSRWNGVRRWSGASMLDAVETVEIPVGYLRLLCVGDLWEGGIKTASQVAHTAKFSDLAIDPFTAEILPCGAQVTQGGSDASYLLPFGSFDGHRQHTTSFVVRLRVDASTSIVVPSIELTRFYFGAAGSLLKAIFSGALAKRELVLGSRIDSAGVANIIIPARMHYTAAPAIARIAFDSTAEAALNMLIQSGVSASVDGRPWYPKMGFPIRGKTSLSAKGLWIEEGGHRTFLVFKLLSCAHPLPFRKLFYSVGRSEGEDAAPPKPRVQRMIPKGQPQVPKTISLAKRPVFGRQQFTLLAGVDEVVPFPDLTGKPLVRAGDVEVAGYSCATATGKPAALSAGGDVGVAIAGVDVVSARQQSADDGAVPDLLWCMDATLRELRPDIRPLLFGDGRRMRRLWLPEKASGDNGGGWGWVALLEHEAAIRFATPTLVLINVEDPRTKASKEFLAIFVHCREPLAVLDIAHSFLRDFDWGVSEPNGTEPYCLVALSSEEVESLIGRNGPHEVTRLIADCCWRNCENASSRRRQNTASH